MRQMVETVRTNCHIVERHANRVGGESLLVEDRDFRVSLTEVSQQSEFGSHRTAHFDRLEQKISTLAPSTRP